jgi:hypothetical protein
MAVLCLSANTSFADFPRLCRVLAMDGFLPPVFAHQGARLVYSMGIVLLAVLSGVLLVVFGGVTDRLIPLFAVGAFLAFTMSQLGMVAHRLRQPPPRRHLALVMNGVGAAATGATLIVILVSKLVEGAWITVLLVAVLLLVFRRVAAHLDSVDQDLRLESLDLSPVARPLVLVPMKRLDQVTHKGLRFALAISDDVEAVQLLAENRGEEDLSSEWAARVESPCRRAGLPVPKLVVLRSPYREVLEPLVRHVERLTRAHPGRPIAVIVPELVQRRWYHALLHSHTSTLLKALLVQRGGPQVLVVSAPWYVDGVEHDHHRAPRDRRRAGRPIDGAPGLARPDRVATIEEGGDTHA